MYLHEPLAAAIIVERMQEAADGGQVRETRGARARRRRLSSLLRPPDAATVRAVRRMTLPS